MITLYKLTDGDGQTRGGTQWGPGVSHSGTGKGELCGPGWIHAYEHPLIAVLLNGGCAMTCSSRWLAVCATDGHSGS